VKSEAHRRAESEIAVIKKDVARLEAELSKREQSISKKEESLAQADLDLEVASQKESAKGHLVDRLRDELARGGDHLKAFADQKDELRQQLVEMQERSQEIERAEGEIARVLGVVRDLSVLESQALGSGEFALTARDGQILLSAPAASLIAADGKRLESAGQRLGTSLARVGALHPEVGFFIGDTSATGAEIAGLQLLSEAMATAGVSSERVSLEALEASSDGDDDVKVLIRIGFSEARAKPSKAETDLGGPTAG
jgi:hypothetical protein